MSRTSFSDLARRMGHLLSRGVWVRKPRLFLRVVRTTLRLFLFRKANASWLVSVALTSRCNLTCSHCFSKKFAGAAAARGRPELTVDEWEALMREMESLGTFAFDFQGGEVFFYPELERVIRACNPSRAFIGIITNGLLLDDAWAAKLRSWGVDQVAVSIDSALPAEHDAFRNHGGAWEKAVRAVDVALAHGFRVLVNTTVTHATLRSEGVRKLSEFCLGRGVVHNIFIGIPVGNWAGRSDVLIDEEDHRYLAELARATNGRIRRDLYPRMFRSGCPAIKESVHVTEFGDVLPCPFTHISLGNVREHHVKDIVARGLTVEKFREPSEVCVVGQDPEFIERYGLKTFAAREGPLDGEEVFGFERRLPPRDRPLSAG